MKDKMAVELGRRGGKKTSEKYGKDHYRIIQKLSTESRKKNRGRG